MNLFKLKSKTIIKELEHLPAFNIGGHNFNNIRYVDEFDLMANVEGKQQNLREKK